MIPLIWTLVSIVGLVVSALSMREATRIYLATSGISNGRRTTAWVGFVSEIIRVIIYLMFLGIGIWYMMTSTQIIRPAIALALIIVLLLTIVKTALNFWLIRYLVRSEEARLAELDTDRNAREDRMFGDNRRALEIEHNAALRAEKDAS